MREAIGGAWLLYFFFALIFIYVAFIAVIMNYASAYRTNNYIISNVENLEGNVDWSSIKNDVKNKYGYTSDIGYCCTINNRNNVVYRIQTYVYFDIPMLTADIKIPITTDSKTIYNGVCNINDLCK